MWGGVRQKKGTDVAGRIPALSCLFSQHILLSLMSKSFLLSVCTLYISVSKIIFPPLPIRSI